MFSRILAHNRPLPAEHSTGLFLYLRGWWSPGQEGNARYQESDGECSAQISLWWESELSRWGCSLAVRDRQLRNKWPRKCPQNPLRAAATHSGEVGDQVSSGVPALRHSCITGQGDLSLSICRGLGWGTLRGFPHLRKECWEPQSSHIHQKHFFLTFLLFRRKSCFSGTGASAGDLGGEAVSSAGSTSSRLWRTSWNLPSCCRKSYSTLEDREEGRG